MKTFEPRHSKIILQNPDTLTAKTDKTPFISSFVSFGSDPKGVNQQNFDSRVAGLENAITDKNSKNTLKPLQPKLTKPIEDNIQSLLNSERTEALEDSCPSYWKHIPILPPRGQKAEMVDKNGNDKRYRIALFGKWYILRFNPNISETSIEIACTIPKRRMFADLSEFYRWAWAEHYYSELTFREGN